MENKEMGTCKHGSFSLLEGCPQCIAERRTADLAEQVKAKLAAEEGPSLAHLVKMPLNDEPHTTEAEPLMTLLRAAQEEINRQTAISLRPGEDIEARDYYLEGLRFLEYAKDRVIATLEDNKLANNDLSLISKLKKFMEAKKREYLDPLRSQAEAIRETYSTLMDPIIAAERITKTKMLAYDTEHRRIRAEQEEINRLRLEAAQKEAALNDGEITESVNLVEVMPEPAKSVSTEMGSSGMRDNWKYEIVDVGLIPREYMMPDTSLLNTTAKTHHDKKKVDGVRFYNDPIIANRVR